MGVFDRIGETVFNLFSGKKGIILILVIIVSAGVWKYQFSGAAEEGEFWDHIKNANNYIGERNNLWEEARKANNQEDYDTAEQLFRQMVEYDKLAIEETQAAIDVAPNQKLKKWADYMKKSAEYGMLSDQKFVEMVQHSRKGDETSAEASLKEHNEYAKKAKEMLEKAKALEREGLR